MDEKRKELHKQFNELVELLRKLELKQHTVKMEILKIRKQLFGKV
jgi:hypothetical protein